MKMNTLLRAAMIPAAFAAGVGTNQIFAIAASPSAMPQMLNVADVKPSDLVARKPGLAPEKIIGRTDATLLKIQMGAPNKHYHKDSDEIQFVLEGTGTAWFVDKSVPVKPSDLLFIPKGTPHGGFTDGVKIITIQVPPLAPGRSANIP